jgi:hypothetical protein
MTNQTCAALLFTMLFEKPATDSPSSGISGCLFGQNLNRNKIKIANEQKYKKSFNRNGKELINPSNIKKMHLTP